MTAFCCLNMRFIYFSCFVLGSLKEREWKWCTDRMKHGSYDVGHNCHWLHFSTSAEKWKNLIHHSIIKEQQYDTLQSLLITLDLFFLRGLKNQSHNNLDVVARLCSVQILLSLLSHRYAEMPSDLKNQCSARSKAVRAFGEFICHVEPWSKGK